MVATVEQLEAEALQLSAPERARLAERLIASLDEEVEIERAWAEEVQRRLEEFDSGKVHAIPAAEVFAKACVRLR